MHKLLVRSEDFDNAFTFIQHEDVKAAWQILHKFCSAKGFLICWVSPKKSVISVRSGDKDVAAT